MKLIIVPGGGDPVSPIYKKGFELVMDEAEKRGITEHKILSFPGHFSCTGDSQFLSQVTAAEITLETLQGLEEEGSEYMIFARSFGCGVVMSLLLDHSFRNLKRTVMWGPTPAVGIYEVTVHDTEKIERAKKEKGCYVDETTYASCVPFEVQLLRYQGPNILNIGAGSLDRHCNTTYFPFLESYVGPKDTVCFTSISGLDHEVTEYDERYMQLLFKN